MIAPVLAIGPLLPPITSTLVSWCEVTTVISVRGGSYVFAFEAFITRGVVFRIHHALPWVPISLDYRCSHRIAKQLRVKRSLHGNPWYTMGSCSGSGRVNAGDIESRPASVRCRIHPFLWLGAEVQSPPKQAPSPRAFNTHSIQQTARIRISRSWITY